MTEARELFEKIIENDYCIGCGACASVSDSPFGIRMNEYGNIIAYPVKDIDKSASKVLNICPFSNEARNEDELGELFFPGLNRRDSRIGKYLECWAGYVREGQFREMGSSGGIGKWLGYILLKERKIDYFVHVVPNQTKDASVPLFDYTIVSKKEEVLNGSKSAYYPVSLVSVIEQIKNIKGKYAISGIPCFIKALRLLSLQDQVLKDRIKYTIGIICGGMKSANQAKMIGWQLGIKPDNLISIDFRRKYKDRPASYKIYQVASNQDTKVRSRDSYDIFATDWDSGYFKPNACDFCDDVVNETADISIGDAWLPQFEKDPKGTSLIIIRNEDIKKIIHNYKNNKTLALYELTAEDVVKAQAGGFRHRREGLSFRIAKKEKENIWYPKKRVKANEFPLTRKRKKIYVLREAISRRSHIAFLNALNKNDLNEFYLEMKILIRKYYRLNYGTLPVRAFRKIIRIISGSGNKK